MFQKYTKQSAWHPKYMEYHLRNNISASHHTMAPNTTDMDGWVGMLAQCFCTPSHNDFNYNRHIKPELEFQLQRTNWLVAILHLVYKMMIQAINWNICYFQLNTTPTEPLLSSNEGVTLTWTDLSVYAQCKQEYFFKFSTVKHKKIINSGMFIMLNISSLAKTRFSFPGLIFEVTVELRIW